MLLVRPPRGPGAWPAAFVGPLLLLVSACAASALPARAQEARSAHHLEIAFLAGRIDEREETISPLRYHGMTSGGRLAYSAGGRRRLAEVGIWMTAGSLSAERGDGARDRSAGGIGVSIVQRLSSTTKLGLAVEGGAADATHHYQSASVSERIEMTHVSLSPLLDWTPERSRGRLRLRAAVPVVVFVARPYTRARAWTIRHGTSRVRRAGWRPRSSCDTRRTRGDGSRCAHVDRRSRGPS